MTNANDYRRKMDRLTAEQVARILDSGATFGWGRQAGRVDVVERDNDALPAGHDVTWGALWQGKAPPFPGLQAIGSWEADLSAVC